MQGAASFMLSPFVLCNVLRFLHTQFTLRRTRPFPSDPCMSISCCGVSCVQPARYSQSGHCRICTVWCSPALAEEQGALQALARVGEFSAESAFNRTLKEGLREVAEAVRSAQGIWMEHALGDAIAFKRTAETAKTAYGSAAGEQLREEGNALFSLAESSNLQSGMKSQMNLAILKWRAALWLHLDKDHDLTGYSAWDILKTRNCHWAQVLLLALPF